MRFSALNMTLLAMAWFAAATIGGVQPAHQQALAGQITIEVTDSATAKPIPVRMHLKNAKGKPIKPPGTVAWGDHFVFDGKISLRLGAGQYFFEMEAGPEYKLRDGNFTLDATSSDTKSVEMVRFVDMKREGWWSGDLLVHRSPKDIELLMRAEDLHVAPLVSWWNKKNSWGTAPLPSKLLVQFDGDRFYHLMAGGDERNGGTLLYLNRDQPLVFAPGDREYPSPMETLAQVDKESTDRLTSGKGNNVHVDIDRPFWRDMPIWITSGKTNTLQIAHSHMQRDGIINTEAGGKARDPRMYLAPHGNGRWTMEIYYQLLNAGLKVAPSAGSGSGVTPNPVGYNRVYVHCGDTMTWDTWWQGLRAGRVVVTNGPMMRPLVNGELPGHTFHGEAGTTVELDVELTLSTRETIDYLEIVQNGKSVQEVRLADWAAAGGKLPPVVFKESGWMLVRAVTNNPKTYRFAMSGPYYVQIGDHQRSSKSACQFFLDWVEEQMKRVKIADAKKKDEVLKYHEAARDYWKKRLADANAP